MLKSWGIRIFVRRRATNSVPSRAGLFQQAVDLMTCDKMIFPSISSSRKPEGALNDRYWSTVIGWMAALLLMVDGCPKF